MMGSILVLALVMGLLGWLLGIGKHEREPAPEDDLTTPIDEAELAEAEAELAEAESSNSTHDITEDDDGDDWGPGVGHSNLPGIL